MPMVNRRDSLYLEEEVVPTVLEDLEDSASKIKITDKAAKFVRFGEDLSAVVGRVPARDELTIEEKTDTWWTSAEFQGIRLGAKLITKDVRKRDKGLLEGIDEAYARSLHLSCSLSKADFEEMMEDCRSQVECVRGWCARRVTGRGLEKYSSQKHKVERVQFADETRSAVLRLARDASITQEQLAEFYSEYARSAAFYARLMGEADYVVVRQRSSREMTERTEQELSSSTAQPDRRDLLRRSSKKTARNRVLVRQLSQRADVVV